MKIKRIAISVILCIFAFAVNAYVVETRIHNSNSSKYCLANVKTGIHTYIDIDTVR